MAVRLKAALLAGIDAMFPDNATRYITPARAREEFRDWIESLLAASSIQASDTSIVVDRSTPGVVRLRADTSGVVPGPVVYPTLRFGTSVNDVPVSAELTVVGAQGQGVIAAYAGSRHLLIARLASEGDISSVSFSDDSTRTNQLGAFSKYGATVDIGGDAYNVWVSNQVLTQGADVTLTVT